MSVGNLLRAARIAHSGVTGVTDEEITGIRALADNLYFDSNLEDDIQTKILNDTELSDYASDKLYSIRREIRSLNERIRTRLSEYLTGEEGKYLQDGIITMRDNRYVLPSAPNISAISRASFTTVRRAAPLSLSSRNRSSK